MEPFYTDSFGIAVEKSVKEFPRGPRGDRGHRGYTGPQGPQGATGRPGANVEPAFISLSFFGPPVDISPKNGSQPILPLGIVDTEQPPRFIQYIDPDPSNPLADRYIEILPGGAGIYLIQFSLFAQTSAYFGQTQILLQLQAQVNDGTGWNTTLVPFNVFETIFTPQDPPTIPSAFYSSAGTSQGMIYLGEGYKLRAVILAATDRLTIGLNPKFPLLSRDVGLAMHRIAIP